MAGNDAMLLGRKTYAEFASYWPTADPDDPVTAQMNGTRKYVVSTTLTDPAWQNSTVVNGDVTAELTRLKQDQQPGTTGSGTLVRWLLEQGLLDELHLLVHLAGGRQGQEAVRQRHAGSAAAAVVRHLQHGRPALGRARAAE